MGHREFNFIFSERLKNRDISFQFEKREQRSMFIFSTNKENKNRMEIFFKMQTGIFQFGTIAIRYRIFGLYFHCLLASWYFFFFFFFTLYVKSKFLFEKTYMPL